MRCTEADLHSEEHALIAPGFGEKICAFVHAHSVNRNRCRHPFSNVSRQTFGSNRPILQSRNFFVEMTIAKLLVQKLDQNIPIPPWPPLPITPPLPKITP